MKNDIKTVSEYLAESRYRLEKAQDILKKLLCPDCLGYGDKCLAGEPPFKENFYPCEVCKGTGLK